MESRQTNLRSWLTAMPKAELHLHLDGSVRPDTALELSRDRVLSGFAVPDDVEGMRRRLTAPERCADQNELLQAFELPIALMQDVESLERTAGELVEDVAEDGTRYAEIRWAPSLHTQRGLLLAEGIDAVIRGTQEAAAKTEVHVRLIAVALRTHSPEVAEDVARAAVERRGDGITGFDLAGRESEVPDPRPFRPAFDIARSGGLGISCHAGEWGGAAQVRSALSVDPARIAHGAPAAEDADLMRELIARDVTLDICPTSNLQAGVGTDDHRAPLPRLIRAGVPTTINTDDRTVSDLTLNKELDRSVTRLGVTPSEVEATMRRSYRAAFLHHDEVLRAVLAEHFESWIRANPAPS